MFPFDVVKQTKWRMESVWRRNTEIMYRRETNLVINSERPEEGRSEANKKVKNRFHKTVTD